jgi:putative transposase
VRRLNAELKRATEERDIQSRVRRVPCQAVRAKFAFVGQVSGNHAVRRLCMVMGIHPSGFDAWRAQPMAAREREGVRLQGLLKQAWLESGGVYGYRKLTLDLRDLGERSGKPAVVAPNHLQREFTVDAPNRSWVTDITYIRTHEGWLYLAVVPDLWSRMVVGWSMGQCIDTQLVLDALTMALWRRRPMQQVLVHSDQGCQFTGHEWQTFLRDHNLRSSMSRGGKCHDNAVAESFFQLLKRERIRRHSTAAALPPVEFEQRYSPRPVGV